MYLELTMLKRTLLFFVFCSVYVYTGIAYITNTHFKRNTTLDDKRLSGKILKKFSKLSIRSCYRFCASQPFCLRFAYNTINDCWSYRELFESNENNIKTVVGWRNFQMEDLVLPIKLEVHLILSTWDEALTECKNRGMTLAILSNDITFTAAQKYIQTIPELNSTEGTWIGLRSEGNKSFKWIDGTVAADVPWDKNDPSFDEVSCAALHPFRARIRDNTCSKVRYCLCGG